jgi:hypothetical protein
MNLSFPRKRESNFSPTQNLKLDARFRGHDNVKIKKEKR